MVALVLALTALVAAAAGEYAARQMIRDRPAAYPFGLRADSAGLTVTLSRGPTVLGRD